MFTRDVGVIGGAGHIGLPLSLMFADSGLSTVIYDIDSAAVRRIRDGEMPFDEEGAPELLRRGLQGGLLAVEDRPDMLADCRYLVLIVGTPLDEHLNPSFHAISSAIDECVEHLRDGQVLILRSTVYPGMSQYVQRHLSRLGLDINVAYCPERVAQGCSLSEFRQLPQIISAFQPSALAAARELFGRFGCELIEIEPIEAELVKLMTNAFRYIEFAIVNQFYMIAAEHDVDFNRVQHACRHKYPRLAHMPRPGLAAGPCLVKDTMQLAAFCNNQFPLGHTALQINEGLPAFLIRMAKRQIDLAPVTAGILGMAFKGDCDDIRDSLSFKLRKLLRLECRDVICTDPLVQSEDNLPLEQVVAEADVLFVATPHTRYRSLEIPPEKIVVDVWNCLPAGDPGLPPSVDPLAKRVATASDSWNSTFGTDAEPVMPTDEPETILTSEMAS